MSVEIWLRTANFRNFRKTRGCMMIFQQASQESKRQRTEGLVATAAIQRLSEPSSIREKHEKEAAESTVAGSLNSRSAGFVSSVKGPEFPGPRGRRPGSH